MMAMHQHEAMLKGCCAAGIRRVQWEGTRIMMRTQMNAMMHPDAASEAKKV